ncbi:MAG: AAA domain-containing protein, partial [Planctomycetota bacterium]
MSHLEETDATPSAVHVLTEQRRMHPDVCGIVSNFQYKGILTTASDRVSQASKLTSSISEFSRAIWYVLDEESNELAAIRATRGPGNSSWERHITLQVLQKLFSDTSLCKSSGLYISPFKAQTQLIGKFFSEAEISSWDASTVHSQQGTEADVVIFDTVNAGSHTWGIAEWKRMVNVALSRAREAVIVLTSRSEMEEPYLRPLLGMLEPAFLAREGAGFVGGFRALLEALHRIGFLNPSRSIASSRPARCANSLNSAKRCLRFCLKNNSVWQTWSWTENLGWFVAWREAESRSCFAIGWPR